MKPDPYFVRQLKEVDKNLVVVWSPTMEVFCIFYNNPDGRSFKITEVRDEDDKFMPLDQRTIDKLRRWDTRRSGLSAAQIAKAQFDAFQKKQLDDRKKIMAERKYKAKQMVGFWSRLAQRLLDQKRYSVNPIKPMLNRMNHEKITANQKLVERFGMPGANGKSLVLSK